MNASTNNLLNSKWKLVIGALVLLLAIVSSFVSFKYAFASEKSYPITETPRELIGKHPDGIYNSCLDKKLTNRYSCDKDRWVTNVDLRLTNQCRGIEVVYDSHAGSNWFTRKFMSVYATFKIKAIVDGKEVAKFSVETWNYVNGDQYQTLEPGDIQETYLGWSKSDAKKLAENAGQYLWYIDEIIVHD